MVPFLAHQNKSESAEAVIAFGKELTFFMLLLISVVIILSSWLDSPKGSKKLLLFHKSSAAKEHQLVADTVDD